MNTMVQYIPVIKNPTGMKSIKEILEFSDDLFMVKIQKLRGVLDVKEKDIYIWGAQVMVHHEIFRQIRKQYVTDFNEQRAIAFSLNVYTKRLHFSDSNFTWRGISLSDSCGDCRLESKFKEATVAMIEVINKNPHYKKLLSIFELKPGDISYKI